ncbi:MAG: NBR1-Ig-like domain-containing protein [Bellilinea sp.]
MRSKKFLILTLVLVLTMLLSACNAFGPAAQPTPDPAAIQATLDAVAASALETLAFQLTSTAQAVPTNTPVPTLEPTATPTTTLEPTPTQVPPTATNTRIPATATSTFTPTPGNYSCQIVSISPASGSSLKVGVDFDMIWTVKNNGLKNWDVGTLDLKYDSGQKMQSYGDVFDMNTLVETGKELKLVVDMVMPTTTGTYTATWKLLLNGASICSLPVNVVATD